MTFAIFPRASLALALALAAAPVPLLAQEVVQPLPGTTDADKLGDVMRRVAQNPRDVDALVEAAELSIHLDDLSGAASLLARAEKVDARDPRIKAGMGSILVRSERPGEALRYFTQAEAAGMPPARFAGDRGLAYDLIGDQARAQRDYRLALASAPTDEIVRRYALSLGISGQREQALEQLDPLLRKTDRAAWRARAFILAMGGDLPEATRIASTMMPPQLAQGLQPFFQRLPSLPAVDRAFAVHFGETRPTPERLADAKLAPNLPPLTPDAPVALASAPVATPAPVSTREDRRRGGRNARGVAMAANTTPATPAPTQMASATSPRVAAAPMRMVQPLPQTQAPTQPQLQPGFTSALPSATEARAPVQMASNTTRPMIQPLPAAPVTAPATATSSPTATAMVQPLSAAAPSTPPLQMVQTVPAPDPVPVKPTPVATAMVQPLPSKVEDDSPASRPTRVAARRTPPTPARSAREDSVLARIVANLSIPASELGVEGPERPAAIAAATPVSSGAQRVVAEARAKTERDRQAREKAEEAEAAPRAPTAAEKKAAAAKAAAEKKALVAKKAEAEKKALAAKEEAEEKKRARANPERIWVQVAGGANEDDLPKAWAATKAKAPELFAARKGYKTPIRATHRVLTGPFKTDAEARAFVNQLAKKGVSAFPVTSDAGQAVTRLDAK
ncbi:SPOR domain-containing protein [Sphingomonas sanguinis]|uniref:SPOR domain-containing protein n=1 Tax=Sphingomonas sanguinis TaxID=33051 RepID=A0ABU5LRV6_9SPHN|nr:SPOR domain-containing protein [Sphingomonas sanguinis]MDZ7282665.1 SPOR domain-containing protein [Sphingomonas sanguinis]